MDPVLASLAAAVDRDGRTLEQLIVAAQLKLHASTLGRKLRGVLPITVGEAMQLATAVGMELRLVRSRRARPRAGQ